MTPNGDDAFDRQFADSQGCIWRPSRLHRNGDHCIYPGVCKTTRMDCFLEVCKCTKQCKNASQINILKRLNHKNLIRLKSLEEGENESEQISFVRDSHTQYVADIMCKPEYGFGFPDEMFLSFLKDLKSGLTYWLDEFSPPDRISLHDIVLSEDEYGQILFKLDPFSLLRSQTQTAKGKEKTSSSKQTQEDSTASISFWQSLGEIILYVCTGKDPESQRGSAAKEKIISDLPPTCLLSESLHAPVLRLINALWDKSVANSVSTNSLVDDITERLRLKVYSSVTGQNLSVYVRASATCKQLKEHLFELTNVPPPNQLLLVKETPICKICDITKELKDYSKSFLESKLCLYDIERYGTSIYSRKNFHIPTLPEIPSVPEKPSYLEIMSAPDACREMMSFTHYFCTCLDKMIARQTTQGQAEDNLRKYVRLELTFLQTELREFQQKVLVTRSELTNCYEKYKRIPLLKDFVLHRATSSGVCNTEEVRKIFNYFSDCTHDERYLNFSGNIKNAVEELIEEANNLNRGLSTQEKDMFTSSIFCRAGEKCGQILQCQKSRISQVHEKLSKASKTCQTPSDNPSAWTYIVLTYKSEMQNLKKHRETLERICNEHCIPNREIAFAESATRMSSLVENLIDLDEKKRTLGKLQGVFEMSVQKHLPAVEDHVKTIFSLTDEMVESHFRGVNAEGDVELMINSNILYNQEGAIGNLVSSSASNS